MLLITCFAVLAASAEDYGIKVGGVSVTSSNCTNITGDNIKCYKEGENYYAKYDPSTNILTLKNIKIERTGKDNRAIYNTDCKDLTIVFDGKNYLYARNSAPVRLEKSTTIKCRNTTAVTDCQIMGVDEDAIYITNGATLKLDNAALYVRANNSSSIVGKTGKETLKLTNSSLWIYCDNTDTEEYCLYDIRNLYVEASSLKIEAKKIPLTKNLELASMYVGMKYLPAKTSSGYKDVGFSSVFHEFLYTDNSSGPKTVMMCYEPVRVNETNFPDKNFREYILSTAVGADGYLMNKNAYGNSSASTDFIYDETTKITKLNLDRKNVESLSGIENFTSLKELYCGQNKLTTLDLAKNEKLTIVSCGNNALTSLTLPASAPLTELHCQNNKLTSLTVPASVRLNQIDCYGNNIQGNNLTAFIKSLPKAEGKTINLVNHSNTSERNQCTAAQVAQAAAKGWTLQHYYNYTTYYAWTPTAGCPHIYKLTYLIDGTVYKTLEVEEGKSVTPLTNPEDNYYYYAWEDEPATMPDHDVEVHAYITAVNSIVNSNFSDSKAIYDLQGRKVANPMKGHIYILNGKKIVM